MLKHKLILLVIFINVTFISEHDRTFAFNGKQFYISRTFLYFVISKYLTIRKEDIRFKSLVAGIHLSSPVEIETFFSSLEIETETETAISLKIETETFPFIWPISSLQAKW